MSINLIMHTLPSSPHVPTHHVTKSSSPCRTSLLSPTMWFMIRSLTADISRNQSIATNHPRQQDTDSKRHHARTSSSHTNKGDPKHSSYHRSSMKNQKSGTHHCGTLGCKLLIGLLHTFQLIHFSVKNIIQTSLLFKG